MNIQIFPLVVGNSSLTRPAYKREYLYIRSYNCTIKLTLMACDKIVYVMMSNNHFNSLTMELWHLAHIYFKFYAIAYGGCHKLSRCSYFDVYLYIVING